MKVRGLLVAVAFVLAGGATAAVVAYVHGVRQEANANKTGVVTVIVANQDIPAGAKLDDLISSGVFTTLDVPNDALVAGAVTDLSQLQGAQTSLPILAGEQIPAARLVGSANLGGGILNIPKGDQALTIQLENQRVVAGVVAAGDHVTVYTTFEAVSSGDAGFKATGTVPSSGNGKAQNVTISGTAGVSGLTVTLVADALVLASDPTSSLVTLALDPTDAARVVFAKERGSLWLSLLPPGQAGVKAPPVTARQAIR